MITVAELARAARGAFELARTERDVREVGVFAAANTSLLARLCYTSHIPCNGVEEPKSTDDHGLGLHVVFEHPDGPRVGFGSKASDLGPDGARRALGKARGAAIVDPEFVSLPRPSRERQTLASYHDPDLMRISDDRLVEAGWTLVHGALRALEAGVASTPAPQWRPRTWSSRSATPPPFPTSCDGSSTASISGASGTPIRSIACALAILPARWSPTLTSSARGNWVHPSGPTRSASTTTSPPFSTMSSGPARPSGAPSCGPPTRSCTRPSWSCQASTSSDRRVHGGDSLTRGSAAGGSPLPPSPLDFCRSSISGRFGE
jgi:hypothetical protein